MKDFLIGLGFCIMVFIASVGLAACWTVMENEERKQLKQDIREIIKDEAKKDSNNG